MKTSTLQKERQMRKITREKIQRKIGIKLKINLEKSL